MDIHLQEKFEQKSEIYNSNENKDNLKKVLLLKRKDRKPLNKSILNSKRTFHCQKCAYVTDRKNNLKRHVSTMHELCDKLLECCDTVFPNKAALREHVMLRHKEGYVCRECGRNFCRKALLKRHVTVHSGQKDYVCSVCGYATSHKSNLDRHTRRHRPKDYSGSSIRDASGLTWGSQIKTRCNDSNKFKGLSPDDPLVGYNNVWEMDLLAIRLQDKYNMFLDGHINGKIEVNRNSISMLNTGMKEHYIMEKVENERRVHNFCNVFTKAVAKIDNRCTVPQEESSNSEDELWKNNILDDEEEQLKSGQSEISVSSPNILDTPPYQKKKLFSYIYRCFYPNCSCSFSNQLQLKEHEQDVLYHSNLMTSPQRPLTLQVRAIIKKML